MTASLPPDVVTVFSTTYRDTLHDGIIRVHASWRKRTSEASAPTIIQAPRTCDQQGKFQV